MLTAGYFRYTKLQSYVPGNPDFPDERAGSNDSSYENFVVTPSPDAFAYIDFNYLLPLGSARDMIINEFVIEDGLLKSGATVAGHGTPPKAAGAMWVSNSSAGRGPWRKISASRNSIPAGFPSPSNTRKF